MILAVREVSIMETEEIEKLIKKREDQVKKVLEFASHITCEHQEDKENLFMVEKNDRNYCHFKIEDLLFEARIEEYPIHNKTLCVWEEKPVFENGISYPFSVSFKENSLEDAEVLTFSESFWPKLENIIDDHTIIIQKLKKERNDKEAKEAKQRANKEKRRALEEKARRWKVSLE
ncbi:MAG: hypothetical protein WC909_01870 [Candidatus Paceibacterota bacterium]|jgi:hypothetical protein